MKRRRSWQLDGSPSRRTRRAPTAPPCVATYLGATEEELRGVQGFARLAAMSNQRRLFPHQGTIELREDSLLLEDWRTIPRQRSASVELTFTDAYSRWVAGGIRGGRTDLRPHRLPMVQRHQSNPALVPNHLALGGRKPVPRTATHTSGGSAPDSFQRLGQLTVAPLEAGCVLAGAVVRWRWRPTGKARAIRFATLEAIRRELDCQPGNPLEHITRTPFEDSDTTVTEARIDARAALHSEREC